MPPNRTFSFNDNDEHILSPHEQDRLAHTENYQQRYQDSPTRIITSPPPQYTSPPPDPPSPVSPAASHFRSGSFHSYSQPQDGISRDIPRRPIAAYNDEAPPPLPPPHRTSPTRPQQLDSDRSDSERSIGYASLPVAASGLNNPANRNSFYGAQERGFVDNPYPGSSPYYNDGRTNSRDMSMNSFHGPNPRLHDRASYGSGMALAAGASTPGTVTPGDARSSRMSGYSIPMDELGTGYHAPGTYGYHDSPYTQSSILNAAVNDAQINPHNIADDGDDGFMPEPNRRSGASKAAGPAAAGGVLGGVFGRKNISPSGNYNPVNGLQDNEKSEWLSKQSTGKKKMRWMVGVGIGVVIILVIAGGIVGGVLGTHRASSSSGSGSTNNAGQDTAQNGDLNINSAEIKALMNNKDLHKVFPGMDYTPWGTQYPLCLTYPPSQNNVTRDMAVLSQLTNAVRLYGTDCNQTEMVLHAIDQLQLKDMKVWLGVWIDTNQTTTDRQISQMYKILENTKDLSVFKGAIIGNEALYRAGEDKSQSEQELITILTDARSQFKSKGYNIPIATSDLGDNWNAQLVQVVDFVMSNIHPFFAGVTADVAASWTWDFWQTHDVVLTANTPNVKQIISETGWPSGGGTDCGGTDGSCAPGQSGSVANVDGMNTFMNDWVCQSLANGTEYFW